MDSSRRAVESYWRSKMIDGATSDEDKVTPVYKLEEICDLLRSAHVSIVKEVSDFILKRLDHKSPIVKQKALRLIKYAVGKSGVEFRREMQRHSVAVRQLLHYKGEADPLKGDALNKAVRETANEALAAIFSEENNKVAGAAPTVGVNRRIEGFGNTNFHMVTEEKKSFLSEVVDLGSQTIKQGLSSLTQSHSMKKSGDIGSYRSPNLHRNLTAENDDYSSRYEPVQLRNETQSSLGVSRHAGPWGQDSRATTVTSATTTTSVTNGDANSSYAETKTREERLLETIVTSGGVRLQPTRDAIQIFLVEASKMDALALTRALESKLQSPVWQVRMKAVCVLEAILRKKEDEHFSIVYSYFSENKDVVVKCSESPQSSLREKANKVLSLLGSEQAIGLVSNSNKSVKAETSFVQMPDLIDTGDSDDFLGRDDSRKKPSDQKNDNQTTQTAPLIDDLLGDDFGTVESTREQKSNDDPFADVSFHTSEGKGTLNDLFSGTTGDDKPENNENRRATSNSAPVLFDIFGSNAELSGEQGDSKTNVNDLMAGMSISENSTIVKQKESSPMIVPENAFSVSSHPSHQPSNDALTGMLGPQMMAANTNPMFSSGTMPYNIPPGMMLNPAFQAQPINYGSMGSFFAHQQLLATVSNFQHLSNFNGQMASISHPAGSTGGGQTSPIPDIFQANFPNQAPASLMNGSKKEETRAFDFISDHLAAARDPKRVV